MRNTAMLLSVVYRLPLILSVCSYNLDFSITIVLVVFTPGGQHRKPKIIANFNKRILPRYNLAIVRLLHPRRIYQLVLSGSAMLMLESARKTLWMLSPFMDTSSPCVCWLRKSVLSSSRSYVRLAINQGFYRLPGLNFQLLLSSRSHSCQR